jgi:hypothetical protein
MPHANMSINPAALIGPSPDPQARVVVASRTGMLDRTPMVDPKAFRCLATGSSPPAYATYTVGTH